MEDINLLFTYIETELSNGKKNLLGSGITVNGETLMNLFERLKAAVSEATGENVLTSANLKAQKIVTMAEERRSQILDNDTIIADAYAIAEKIKNDALLQRNKASQEFNSKLFNMLDKVNNNLKVAVEQVENSMEYIGDKIDD
jgi:hypothetical protein